MIVVNARLTATVDIIAAMTDAIIKMEKASRAEPGCDGYTFSVELGDPSTMLVTERWADLQALKDHFVTPHMDEFQGVMAQHTTLETHVYCYEVNEIPLPPMPS